MNQKFSLKPTSFFIPLALFIALLTGCSSSPTSQETASQTSTNQAPLNETSGSSDSSGEATDATQSSNATGSTEQTTSSAPTTNRPYINRLLPEAQRIQEEYGVPLDTTLAIAIHETGWGKYEIGKNNHFGLRCASDDCITLSKGGADIQYETCPDDAECFNMFAESITELSNGKPGDLRVIYKNGYATGSGWVRKVRRIRRQVRETLKESGISTTGS